jgi:hypothetical protein
MAATLIPHLDSGEPYQFVTPTGPAQHTAVIAFDISGKVPVPVYHPALPADAKLFRTAHGGWNQIDPITGLVIGATITGPKW